MGLIEDVNAGWLDGRASPLFKRDGDSSAEGSGDEHKTAGEEHHDYLFVLLSNRKPGKGT